VVHAVAGGLVSSRPVTHPETIGAYRILEFLGEGGMGLVYRAEHRTVALARRQGPVVIKTLHPQLARRPEFRERFEQEAEVGAAVDHPGVVRYLDLVADQDTVALVMAFVPGRELADQLDDWREPERLVSLLGQLAETLDHLHGLPEPVIHRDLKPSNVLVASDGRPVLIDFGIARAGASQQTRTGTGMGTVHYMAPEQYIDAKRVDARADVYALALIALRLLTGALPWDEELSEYKVLQKKDFGQLDLGLAGPAQEVFEQALAPKLEDRFARASAFVTALRGSLGVDAATPPGQDPGSPEGAGSKARDRSGTPAFGKPAVAPRKRCHRCHANWSSGAFTANCAECGGGALEKPCPMCSGACGNTWTRALEDSHEYGRGVWIFTECPLSKDADVVVGDSGNLHTAGRGGEAPSPKQLSPAPPASPTAGERSGTGSDRLHFVAALVFGVGLLLMLLPLFLRCR